MHFGLCELVIGIFYYPQTSSILYTKQALHNSKTESANKTMMELVVHFSLSSVTCTGL